MSTTTSWSKLFVVWAEMEPGIVVRSGTPKGRTPEPARATRTRSMVAATAPITGCDRGTMQHVSGSGRMLGESDPQERGRCGIGFIGGRMRAALRGNLGHRLSVGAGSRRILFTNLGTPVEFRSRTSK